MSEDQKTDKVSKVNRFDRPGQPPTPLQDESAMVQLPPQFGALIQQVTAAQERITALEVQLTQSQKDHRADNERLLRELMEAKITNAQLAEQLKQKESRE